jgi:hypothetical protein
MANRISEGMARLINLLGSNPPILTHQAGMGKGTGADAVKKSDGSHRPAPRAKMPVNNEPIKGGQSIQ